MNSISNCLAELRSRRQQLDEAILLLERLGAGAARPRRGRPPQWLAAAQAETAGATERKPRAVSPVPKKDKKRKMSAEGKLAIQVGVALRQWKAANPDAGEEQAAKQRERLRQQLQRKGTTAS